MRFSGVKCLLLSWIIARVHNKLEGWKGKLISKGGKEVLIKFVMQALAHYAMSIFKIPLSICKSIEKSIARFWWKNDQNRKGIHWQKWDLLKASKDYGGLGFRHLIAFNEALLGKQACRLLQQPLALRSKLFKGLYFPTQSFLSIHLAARLSWGWKSLLQGRDAIYPHL